MQNLFDDTARIGLIGDGPVKFKLDLPDLIAVKSSGVYGDADGALAVISTASDEPDPLRPDAGMRMLCAHGLCLKGDSTP